MRNPSVISSLPGHPFHALTDRQLIEVIKTEGEAALQIAETDPARAEHDSKVKAADLILFERLIKRATMRQVS